MKKSSTRRVLNGEFYVDATARPGWLTAVERAPAVGEEVFCAAGPGTVFAVLGKTGDGSRLLEIRLPSADSKPFFAAASNVLVAPVNGAASIAVMGLESAESPAELAVSWIG